MLAAVLLALALGDGKVQPTITWSPQAPHSGDTVALSAGAPGAVAWDLDGDGRFEAPGATATTRWTSPGPHDVAARMADRQTVRQTITVLDAAPVAAFSWSPAAATAGSPVTFTSQASDPDGGTLQLQQSWDLDGDGVFGDATGPTATASFPAGDHVVRLRAADTDGAATTAEQVVHVVSDAGPAAAVSTSPARPISPFPVVRLRGRLTRGGVRVSLLTVSGPRGARVAMRCAGGGCPRASVVRRVPVHGPRIVAV